MVDTVVENYPVAQGSLTVFDNGDYILYEGDPSLPDSRSTYFRRGTGPRTLENQAARLIAERSSPASTARGTIERGIGPAERGVRSAWPDIVHGDPVYVFARPPRGPRSPGGASAGGPSHSPSLGVANAQERDPTRRSGPTTRSTRGRPEATTMRQLTPEQRGVGSAQVTPQSEPRFLQPPRRQHDTPARRFASRRLSQRDIERMDSRTTPSEAEIAASELGRMAAHIDRLAMRFSGLNTTSVLELFNTLSTLDAPGATGERLGTSSEFFSLLEENLIVFDEDLQRYRANLRATPEFAAIREDPWLFKRFGAALGDEAEALDNGEALELALIAVTAVLANLGVIGRAIGIGVGRAARGVRRTARRLRRRPRAEAIAPAPPGPRGSGRGGRSTSDVDRGLSENVQPGAPSAATRSNPPRPSGNGGDGNDPTGNRVGSRRELDRRSRGEGSIRGTRRLPSDPVTARGEAANADAFARRGHDVINIPESTADWEALIRTRPEGLRGSEGQRGMRGSNTQEGASWTRREVEQLRNDIRVARRRDRLPSHSNPDHLIDGLLWESKVLRPGSFNPRSAYQDVLNNAGRQARRFAINIGDVVENGVQRRAADLIVELREWIRSNSTPAQLRHGLFGAEVDEVVFIQSGRIYPVYSRR